MYSARVNMQYDKNDVIEAVFQLDENFRVVSGDERIYQLLGDNTMYTMSQLLHPDDLDGFRCYMESGDMNEPYLARCLVKNQMFRWLLLQKINITNGKMKRLVEVKAQNVVAVCERFDSYFMKMKKYRTAINQIKDKMFEYDFNTGFITIYCYVNNRSEIIEKDYIGDWKNRMLRLGYVEDQTRDQFEMLCNNMQNGADSFSLTFETSMMSKGERKDTINFRGQTIQEGSKKILVMGLITEIGTRMKDKQILITSDEGSKDSATGVLNKKTIQNEITDAINKAKATYTKNPLFMIIMDIDDFKRVNDTYGHYFGDEVILTFAQTLKQVVGERGLVGRVGGDEFLVLLKDVESEDAVKVILKSIRTSLSVILEEKQPGYHFTISAGIARYNKDADNYDDLFKTADAALYIAKGKGKDRYIIYDEEKHGDFLRETSRNGHIVYSGGFMKPMEKFDMAAKLMIRIGHQGKESMGEVLYELMDKLNIHGITVYMGCQLKKEFSLGHYQNTIDCADYVLETAYLNLFDEYGINKINNISSLAVDFPDRFRQFKGCNICSALQIFVGRSGEIHGMFQFDTFGENRRKWNDDDVNVVRMVVTALEDVLAEE